MSFRPSSSTYSSLFLTACVLLARIFPVHQNVGGEDDDPKIITQRQVSAAPRCYVVLTLADIARSRGSGSRLSCEGAAQTFFALPPIYGGTHTTLKCSQFRKHLARSTSREFNGVLQGQIAPQLCQLPPWCCTAASESEMDTDACQIRRDGTSWGGALLGWGLRAWYQCGLVR